MSVGELGFVHSLFEKMSRDEVMCVNTGCLEEAVTETTTSTNIFKTKNSKHVACIIDISVNRTWGVFFFF